MTLLDAARDAIARLRAKPKMHRHPKPTRYRNPRVIAKLAKQAQQKPWVPVMERKNKGGRV